MRRVTISMDELLLEILDDYLDETINWRGSRSNWVCGAIALRLLTEYSNGEPYIHHNGTVCDLRELTRSTLRVDRKQQQLQQLNGTTVPSNEELLDTRPELHENQTTLSEYE